VYSVAKKHFLGYVESKRSTDDLRKSKTIRVICVLKNDAGTKTQTHMMVARICGLASIQSTCSEIFEMFPVFAQEWEA